MQDIIREYGSEFDLESNRNYIYSNSENSFFLGAEFFRSGRDAMRAIANRYKGSYKRILFPSLCCESMVTPFQNSGYEVLFYKLNPDLTAKKEDVLSKLNRSDIFLYMDFFGIQSLNVEELQHIRMQYPNAILIEDKTHSIFSNKCNEFMPDFLVSSIRKWLAIPDGGVLFTKNGFNKFVKNVDSLFSDLRTKALKIKSEYLKSGNSYLKELFRSQLVEANNYLENDEKVVGISPKSFEILKKINFTEICNRRRKNFNTLFKLLKNMGGINHLYSYDTEKTVLYYPIIVSDRDTVQKRLANNGIYCPVIWPLPLQALGKCEVSDYVSAHVLALPCDQRYEENDMEHICNTVNRVLGNEK